MRLLRLCVLFYFTGFVSVLSAQEQTDKKSLSALIPQIEAYYQVKFSYATKNLSSAWVTPPDFDYLSLTEIISFLEKETGLQVIKLSDRYYSLRAPLYFTICGLLIDEFTGLPVAGATIEIPNYRKGVISNSNGYFSIEKAPAKASVKIRHLGYRPFYGKVADFVRKDPCKTFILQTQRQDLEEVVVYQFLTTGLQKQKDGSIEINNEDFGILPGLIEPDVLQTIQALPGIKSINETVSNINIRGGSNDQNLIIWDGIKMYQSGHFFGLISAFNPYLTENVSVIKNGSSAVLTDGVSGTIIMQSKNHLKDAFFGGAGFNLVSADIFGQVPLSEKMALQFSGRRSVTDFLNSPTYNQYFDRAFQDSKITNAQNQEIDRDVARDETFYFYDFSGKLLYDFNPSQKMRLSFINIDNTLNYRETLSGNGQSETKESTLDQRNIAFGGHLQSTWNSTFSTEIKAYYTKYNLNATNLTLLTDQRLIQENEVLETGISLNTFYQYNEQIKLLNGYQFYEVGISNTQDVNIPFFRQITKDVLRNHAVYTEATYNSDNEATYVRAGVRLNYFEKFNDFILEPRLSINRKLGASFSVEVQGEFKNQATNQIIDLEEDFLGVEKRRWVLANNKDLPITKSKQVSLGFNYNNQKLFIGIEGFYKKVEGITTSNQGFQNQGQFAGAPGTFGFVGSYQAKGIEFLINKKTNKYSTWLSYTYNTNDYTFTGLNPSSFPNNLDVRHAVTFAGTYTYNRLKMALGLNWRTGRPFTEPDPDQPVQIGSVLNEINYRLANSSRLANYLRIDVSSNYDFRLGHNIKASMGAAVLNVLNRRNVLNTYYRLDSNQGTEIQRVENVSLGITPNLSFRVQF